MSEFNVVQFWPTTLVLRDWDQHQQEAPAIIDLLYQIRNGADRNIASGVASRAKSDEGLFESDFDLFRREHAGLGKLKQFIVESVRSTVSKLNGDKVPPERIRVAIDDAWFHITNDGGFHDAHGHHQCSWCGIYYLKLDKSSTGRKGDGAPNGGNRFYSPIQLGGRYLDYGNQYLNLAYLDPPVHEGQLLLFPSYLTHSALPYSGDEDRIVIAFNSRSEKNPEQ